jgi:hypothetical protein
VTGILCSLPMIGAPTAAPSASALAVSLNRTSVSGSSTASSITTNSVTATGSGGTSPYTYSCSRVSGDRSISATSSSSRTTSFSRTGCVAGTSYSATWRYTVTDSAGDVVYSSNVSVTITCTASSVGGGGGSSGGTFNGIADTDVSVIANGASQTATYTIKSDGTITTSDGGSATWNSSTTVGSSYEVKATLTSGSLTTGTTGSWLALSSNRSWSKTDTTAGNGGVAAAFTLQIRAAGTTTVLDSATITLEAEAL